MDEYYINQAGTGIGGFQGVRYQKGNGFFGRVVSGTVMPILKKVLPFLGKTALSAGSDLLSDIENGSDFKSSVKKRFSEGKKKIGRAAMEKVKLLTGEGKKRRFRRKKSKPAVATNKRRKKTTKKGKRKPRKTKAQKRRRSKKVAKDFL